MYMDINIEEVPDVASVQEEQFAQLTSLAPAVVFPPQIYIEASSLRNKKRLLEQLNGEKQMDPVAAEMQKISAEQAIKRAEAEIQKLKAETLKITVEADVADAQIGMIQMPTVVGEGQSPDPQGVPAAGVDPGVTAMPPPGYSGA